MEIIRGTFPGTRRGSKCARAAATFYFLKGYARETKRNRSGTCPFLWESLAQRQMGGPQRSKDKVREYTLSQFCGDPKTRVYSGGGPWPYGSRVSHKGR